MKTIVQKYGGTSVNTADNRKNIIQNAKDAINEVAPDYRGIGDGRFPEAYARTVFWIIPRKIGPAQ
jgi:hypothetical protein